MQSIRCRHCKKEAISCDFKGRKNKKNLLFQCQNPKCKTFFWHGRVRNEFNLKEKPNSKDNILREKQIIKSLSIPLRVRGRYVYVLALSKLDDVKLSIPLHANVDSPKAGGRSVEVADVVTGNDCSIVGCSIVRLLYMFG